MKITLFYYWNTASYMKGNEIDVTIHERDLTESVWSDRILVKTLEIDIPDCEPPTREKQIDSLLTNLDKQEAEINARAFMELQAVKEKRQQLLALTCEPEAA